MGRACRAIVDLEAIQLNYRLACRLAPNSRNVAVVKADAYGHGAVDVCRALVEADAFGVASIDEALELREAAIRQPILLLQGFVDPSELTQICEHRLWTIVHCKEQVEVIARSRVDSPLVVWLKLDTGMHRLGLGADEFPTALAQLRDSRNVGHIVLVTHFVSSDEPENPLTRQQIARFRRITSEAGLPVSLANSGAVLAWPEAHGDWNRPGFMLYGNSPFSVPNENAALLRPAMRLQADIIAVRKVDPGETVGYAETWTAKRPSRIATVSIGYGDGYPQQAPNGTPVLVNGERAELAGRVSMDMITVDVTDMAGAKIGDPVVLWGPELSVNEVAAHVGSIGYELLTRLPVRLQRELSSP